MKPHLLQMTLTHSIIFCLLSLSMVTAVNFDNQASMPRHKVGYIVTHYVLAQKVDTRDTVPQMLPQVLFGYRRIPSVFSSVCPKYSISVR